MGKLVVESIAISKEDSKKPLSIGIKFPMGTIYQPITLEETVEFVNKILTKCIENGYGIEVDVNFV